MTWASQRSSCLCFSEKPSSVSLSNFDAVFFEFSRTTHRTRWCERSVIGQRARLLITRSAQEISLRQHPHGRGKGRSQSSGGWSERWERQNEEREARVEERSNTQAHDSWMRWRAQTPWANVLWDILWVRTNTRKRWRVRVFCSHLPSVAADCHQL